MTEVFLDFETASGVDLKVTGAERYALDPTTEVLSLVYGVNKYSARYLWTPFVSALDFSCMKLRELAADPAIMFVAHSAQFEQAIWRHHMAAIYGFAPIPAERWHCTQAAAAYRGLPLDLDRLAHVLGMPATKDLVGRRVTLGLSKCDRKTGMLPERTTERMEKVYAYNAIDVDLTAPIHRRLGPLPPDERAVWLLDQRINARGVAIDLSLVRAMRQLCERAAVPLVQEFGALTGGLSPNQTAALGNWCAAQGVELPNMRKETLAALLGETENDDEDGSLVRQPDLCDEDRRLSSLPGNVRRVLTIRSLVGSASIKKLAKMEASICLDGRSRGLLQYHGAQPGRWTGRGFQPQNFPRGTIKHDIDEAIAEIHTGDIDAIQARYGNPIELVVSSLRHTVISQAGKLLCAGDFAGIEARLVLAVSGQHDKTELMASGVDVYCDMAASIYDRPITKADAVERHIGKCTILGCGFGMGWKGFHARFCADHPEEFAQRVIGAYRKEWAPRVPEMWKGLELAALRAVYDKASKPYEAYGIEFRKEEGFLSARLYDGKKLWYFDPKPVRRKMPWLDRDDNEVWRDAWTFKTQKLGQWVEVDAYGGLLTQNIVGEGLGRQLLVAAMHRLERHGLPVVLTVHDEALVEVDWKRDPAELKKLVEEIMAERPAWAEQVKLPVQVEGWAGQRYRK